MNLSFYLLVSVVNKVESGREVSPGFRFVTPGVGELTTDLP